MLTVEKAHEPISLLTLTIVLTETGREKESEEVREQWGGSRGDDKFASLCHTRMFLV